MNKYEALQKKHQEEVNAFGIGWAFGKKQYEEMMSGFGLQPTDTDKIVSIGAGGYIKKDDKEKLLEMFRRHKAERKQAVEDDKDGTEFCVDMFYTELSNHEYGYTGDDEDALIALGYTYDDLTANAKLAKAFDIAKKKFRE